MGGCCKGRGCILLNMHNKAGRVWCAGKNLAAFDERCHQFSPNLLQEQPPLVALPLISCWVDLRPQSKCIVGRHVNYVIEDHQGPSGGLQVCSVVSCNKSNNESLKMYTFLILILHYMQCVDFCMNYSIYCMKKKGITLSRLSTPPLFWLQSRIIWGFLSFL